MMKIERVLSWFNKTGEELVDEINIDHVELSILKGIFKSKGKDPLLYDPYTIHPEEAGELQKYLDGFTFDFDRFIYQIDCFEVQ